MSKCPKCGHPLTPRTDIYYCEHCGGKFRRKTPPKDKTEEIIKPKNNKKSPIKTGSAKKVQKMPQKTRSAKENPANTERRRFSRYDIILCVAVVALLCVAGVFGYYYIKYNAREKTADNTVTEDRYATYMQYDRAIITGDAVMDAIKYFKNDPIAISVDNEPRKKEDIEKYDNTRMGSAWYIKQGPYSEEKYDETKMKELMESASQKDSPTYIDPSSDFYGIINKDNGKIIAISFFFVE